MNLILRKQLRLPLFKGTRGSLIYMAPEILQISNANDVDERVDIYSCSIMIWGLLHVRIPDIKRDMIKSIKFILIINVYRQY